MKTSESSIAMTQIQKKQLRDKCLAALTGFLVPGVLGWLTATQGTRINNLISDIFKRVFNPGCSPTASWSWSGYIAIAVIIGICILGYSPAVTFYYRKSDRAWIWFAALPISIILQIAAFQSPLSTAAVFTWSSIVAALVVAGLWPTEIRKEDKVEDKLYREFFASRIVKHLEKPNNFIRRIAVMGPWGSGKTYVLKLIRQALERATESEFRIAWVNPWKASSKQEAIEIFAEAIDQALGQLSVIPLGWQKNKWLGAVASLIPGKDVGQQFLEAVTSHFPQTGEAFLRQVDEEIHKRGFRVVIFVDDMERADPDVVRGILPVIDCLAELKNCYFVFAIDRDQMEVAFRKIVNQTVELQVLPQKEESGKPVIQVKQNGSLAGSMVQGFLDKVMDLQLTLPDPTQFEINSWIGEKIDMLTGACPKLKSAFSLLSSHMPTNPRICEKFLKEAERIEVLFLEDYEQSEQNYYALFLVIMGDVEFPGFRESVGRHFGAFATGAGLMTSGNKLTQSNEFGLLVRNVASEIWVSEQKDDPKYVRIRKLLTGLCETIGLGVFDTGGTPVDVDWICSGYLARLHLPRAHMKLVAEQWECDTGSRSLPEILITKMDGQGQVPSHMEATLFQILEMQLSEIEKAFRQALTKSWKGGDVTLELTRTIRMLEPFSRHFDASRGRLETIEENLLTAKLVDDFIDLIRNVPIYRNDAGKWPEVHKAIVDAFAAVVISIPWERKKTITLELWKLDFDVIENVQDREAALAIVSDVRNRLKESIVKEFITRLGLSQGTGKRPFWIEESWPAPILQPDRWMPETSAGFDLSQFGLLCKNKDVSKDQHSNIIDIVRKTILGPLAAEYRDSSISQALMHQMLAGDKKYRDYLRAFWNVAVGEDARDDSVAELVALRNTIRNRFDPIASGQTSDASDAGIQSSEVLNKIEGLPPPRKVTHVDIDEAFPLPVHAQSRAKENMNLGSKRRVKR
jgi:hypothetical protein